MRREDELRKQRLEQATEFEEQKKAIVEERKWLESLRMEIDQRMGSGASSAAPLDAPLKTKSRGKSSSTHGSKKLNNSNSSHSKRKASAADRR